MNRKLLYVGAIFLVLIVVAFFAVRHYNHRIDVIQGQIIEAKAARLAKEREAAIAMQGRIKAEKQRDLVQATEEAKRKPLEDENRQLAAENAKLKKAEADRQEHLAHQVSTIPSLADTDLAIAATKALESAYPGSSPTIAPQPIGNNITAFTLNRPAVELSLRAGWETISSRASLTGYRDQVTNLEIMVNNSNYVAGSYLTELVAERRVNVSLKNESAGWQESYARLLHENDLREQKDKARSGKGFWSRFVPKIGPGACVTMGQDGRVGYGPCVAAIYPIN